MSARLGVRDKEGLLLDFERLFGRVHTVYPFPLTDEVLVLRANNLVPKRHRRFEQFMRGRGYDTTFWFSYEQKTTMLVGGLRYCTRFKVNFNGDNYQNDDPQLGKLMQLDIDARTTKEHAFDEDQLATAFSTDWPLVRAWMVQYGALMRETRDAWQTINELMNMLSTVGQLKRMVPEILEYLSKDKADELRSYVRASAVPYEWSGFERSRVRLMLVTMAKCHMIGKSKDGMARQFINQEPNCRSVQCP